MGYTANSPIHKVFSLNLNKARTSLGYSQKKMAMGLGIGYKEYCLIERGIGEITLSTSERIATLLGIRVFELFDPQVLVDPSTNSPIDSILCELQKMDEEGLRIIHDLTRALAVRKKQPVLQHLGDQSLPA